MRLGEEGSITRVHKRTKQVSVVFDDDAGCLFPFDAIEEQLIIWDNDELVRQRGLRALRRTIAGLENEKGPNVFDILAMGVNFPLREKLVTMVLTIGFFLIMQFMIPILLGFVLILQRIQPTAEEAALGKSPQWGRLCRPSEKHTWKAIQHVTNLMKVIFSYYLILVTGVKQILMFTKPATNLLWHGLAFHSRILPYGQWSYFGYILRYISLAVCASASIIIISVAEEPLDVVLNSLAIFFLVNLTNQLMPISKFRYVESRAKMQARLDASISDPSLPVVVRTGGFQFVFILVNSLGMLLWYVLAVAVPTFALCWWGLILDGK